MADGGDQKKAGKRADGIPTPVTSVTTATVTVTPCSDTVSQPKVTLPSALSLPTTTTSAINLKSPSEDDPRVKWIYSLNKEELIAEMKRYGINSDGKMEDMRKKFCKFWKEGISRPKQTDLTVKDTDGARALMTEQASNTGIDVVNKRSGDNASLFDHSQRERRDVGLKRITEILGLPPSTDFEAVCRYFSTLSKKNETATDQSEAQRPLQLDNVGGLVFSTATRLSTGVSHSGSLFNRLPDVPGESLNRTANQGENFNWDNDPRGHNDVSSICNLVRKWNIRFDGHRDPISFLERLEELMEAYEVNKNEILKALPELLYSTALLWYRNWKESWRTYDSFRDSFELQFLPPGYRRNLDEEIRRRTQGEHEVFRNFVVAITTLMRRRGGLSIQERLDIIYNNMKPDYKLTMRRDDFYSIEDMLRQAEHVEAYYREKHLFRPPPPPSMSLIPETAYHRRPRDKTDSTAVSIIDRSGSSHRINERTEPVKHVTFEQVKPQRPNENVRETPITRRSECSSELSDATRRKSEYNIQVSDSICWNCNKTGHFYRECKNPKKLRCFYCKKENVRTRECSCHQGNEWRAQEERGRLSTRRSYH